MAHGDARLCMLMRHWCDQTPQPSMGSPRFPGSGQAVDNVSVLVCWGIRLGGGVHCDSLMACRAGTGGAWGGVPRVCPKGASPPRNSGSGTQVPGMGAKFKHGGGPGAKRRTEDKP